MDEAGDESQKLVSQWEVSQFIGYVFEDVWIPLVLSDLLETMFLPRRVAEVWTVKCKSEVSASGKR